MLHILYMKGPLFSIIIPCHNEEEHIAETIKSIIKQTEQSFEIIVVNDGSQDRTLLEIEPFLRKHKNIKLISFDRGHSAAFARNRGLEYARGQYIVFQDADCYADMCLLNNAAKWFEDLPIDGLATRTTNTPPKNWIQKATATQRSIRWENTYNSPVIKYLDKNSGINVAVMKREAAQALGGFSESIFYFEDNDLTKRFFESGRTAVFAPDVIQYHNDPLSLRESIRQCKSIAKGMKSRKELQTKEVLMLLFGVLGLVNLAPYILIFLHMFIKSKDAMGSFYFTILWEIRTLAKLYYFLLI